jgi:hypothetical protein
MPNLPVVGRRPPTPAGKAEFRRELRAIVISHRSDPSIVMWIPFNEGWDQFEMAAITRQVKRLDPASLVDSDSGSANCCNAVDVPGSDVRDTHLYFGPYAARADRRASVIGEYGGVLAFPPPGHAWPGTLTSIGSPALPWPVPTVSAFLRQQYAELAQEMRVRGLSGAVFTELGSYEQELGIISYDRRVFTMPPSLLRRLNGSLIHSSQRRSGLRREPARVPPGTTGLWQFDEGHGTTATDTSGRAHPLFLQGGAVWTRGFRGAALTITAPGQSAVTSSPVLDSTHAFSVAVWLRADRPWESGSAVSEPGPAGPSFSLGIQTGLQGAQSLSGEVGRRTTLSLGEATWWTFAVPAAPSCTILQCGVRANNRYSDGRADVRLGAWYQLTGVYDPGTQTITVYVDGVPVDVEHVDGIPPATGALRVGAGTGAYAPSDTFFGAIDRLRVYSRALSPREVWELFRADQRR